MSKKVVLVDQIAEINYKYTFSLATELLKKGIDIHLVLDLKKNEECDCKTDNIFLTDEKVSKVKKVLNLFSSYRRIKKIVKQEKIDIVHIQWISFSPIEYYLIKSLARKVKVVMTIHDILPFNEKKYDKHFFNKIYKIPDSLILQAKTNIDRFKELFPQYADKVVYIPHGNYLKYAEIVDKNEARKALSVPEDKFVFLFFGQIKRIKGVDILLEAFTKYKVNHPEAMLIVAGQVWKAEEELYEGIIAKNNLTNDSLKWDIKFVPNEQIPLYYSASDICVLPYTDLYQSGVIQLAYAYHKCPIVSDLEPFKEIVDETTGYVFKNKDVDSLVEAMEKAYANRRKNNILVEKGYEKILKIYSWESIAEDIIHKCY